MGAAELLKNKIKELMNDRDEAIEKGDNLEKELTDMKEQLLKVFSISTREYCYILSYIVLCIFYLFVRRNRRSEMHHRMQKFNRLSIETSN